MTIFGSTPLRYFQIRYWSENAVKEGAAPSDRVAGLRIRTGRFRTRSAGIRWSLGMGNHEGPDWGKLMARGGNIPGPFHPSPCKRVQLD
jgi:hypothetical protein